MRRNR